MLSVRCAAVLRLCCYAVMERRAAGCGEGEKPLRHSRQGGGSGQLIQIPTAGSRHDVVHLKQHGDTVLEQCSSVCC